MNHIFSYLVSKSVRWYEKKGHIQVQGDPRWPNGCSFEWSDVVSQAIEYPLVSSAPWFAGKSPSNRSIIFPVFCPHHGWRGLFSIVKSPLSTWAFPKIWGNPKSPWVSIPRWTSLGWFVGTSMTWVNFRKFSRLVVKPSSGVLWGNEGGRQKIRTRRAETGLSPVKMSGKMCSIFRMITW